MTMHYIIITQPTAYLNESKIINYILDNDLATIHLRKPDYTINELRELLDEITTDNHGKIVIHNHFELINKYNLKGIHFTKHSKHLINEFNSHDFSKSISSHSLEEIDQLPSSFNYYFLSPIFQSTSKQGYGGNSFKMEDIQTFIEKNPLKKLVALSGINHKNINDVYQTGFYGAAILGGFWNYCTENIDVNKIPHFFKNLNTAIQ